MPETPKTKKIVGTVVGAAVIGLLVYEFWSLGNKDEEDTLSENYWRIAARNTALPFSLGFLMGHLNWQSEKVTDYFRNR